jgi:DNA polymerase-3 subunit beta
MKFECARRDLHEALTVAAAVVPVRTAIPALANVLVQARPGKGKQPGTLKVSATDMELSVELTVAEARVEAEGALALPAARLAGILRESAEETVRLEADGHLADVRAGSGRYKLVGLEAADFPSLPRFEGAKETEVAAPELQRMIRLTEFAVSTESVMVALTGLLLELHEGKELRLVASDGKRLAYARSREVAKNGARLSVLVPPKALKLLDRLLTPADELAWIYAPPEENAVQLRTVRGLITSRLIEGKFPDYENVIPKDRDKKAVVEAAALAAAVRRTALMAADAARAVRLGFAKGKCVLFTRSADVGEARTETAAEFAGEPFEIIFNPDFLLDYLKVVDGASVEMHMKDPGGACVFGGGGDYTYVLMPLQVQL